MGYQKSSYVSSYRLEYWDGPNNVRYHYFEPCPWVLLATTTKALCASLCFEHKKLASQLAHGPY